MWEYNKKIGKREQTFKKLESEEKMGKKLFYLLSVLSSFKFRYWDTTYISAMIS